MTCNILGLCQSMLEQTSSGAATSPTTFSQLSSSGLAPSQVQDALPRPRASLHRAGTHSPSPSSTQKLPSKAELLVIQSRSMKSIAGSMEARTKGKETLLFLKMDINMEKKKGAKIASLERVKDSDAIVTMSSSPR